MPRGKDTRLQAQAWEEHQLRRRSELKRPKLSQGADNSHIILTRFFPSFNFMSGHVKYGSRTTSVIVRGDILEMKEAPACLQSFACFRRRNRRRNHFALKGQRCFCKHHDNPICSRQIGVQSLRKSCTQDSLNIVAGDIFNNLRRGTASPWACPSWVNVMDSKCGSGSSR